MTTTELPPTDGDADDPPIEIGVADVLCGLGLAIGLIASWVFIGLTPKLLAHHGILLEALSGSNAAIVSGGAFARIGQDSLFLVIIAPLGTILLYDVFFWWAGRLWGNKIAAFYTENNPRAARWIDRTETLVRRRGVLILIVGYYLLPIPRVLIFLTCGTSGMPLATFLIGDLIGLLLWEATMVGLGWAIGHPAVHVVNEIAHYSTRVTIALVVGLVIVMMIRGARARSRQASGDGDIVTTPTVDDSATPPISSR